MAKKVRKKNREIDSYRHESDSRKNAVPVDFAAYNTSKPKPREYHLDTQLVQAGKVEHTSIQVLTIYLPIHERIAPEAVVRSIKYAQRIKRFVR